MKFLFAFLLVFCFSATVTALDVGGLQKKLDAARPGEVIVIPAGDYRGSLVIRRGVTVRAQPGVRLIHEPGLSGPTLWIQADDARVEGLRISGSGSGTRRDSTAVVVTGRRVVLSGLMIDDAWSGLWVDGGDGVRVSGLVFAGLRDFPFWERGEGIRVTATADVRLEDLELSYVSDGVYLEKSSGISIQTASLQEGRYGLHLMFSVKGEAAGLKTKLMVAGLMAMESADWLVRDSAFVEGYRTGSAGVREVRTKRIAVERSTIARQRNGVELLDVREGSFRENQIRENAVAWTWGGDNSLTAITKNNHLGNLVDVSGSSPKESDLVEAGAHDHGKGETPASVAPVGGVQRPGFSGNYWDAWRGLDLNNDGYGDTPHRFDPQTSSWMERHNWSGFFLGSPWTLLSQRLPGGDVLDDKPLMRPTP